MYTTLRITNRLLAIVLILAAVGTAHAQENYNPNNYKYRFQKLRGFSTNYNLDNNGALRNEKQSDTLYSRMNKYNSSYNDFRLRFNFYYFKNINTENIQQNVNAGLALNYQNGLNNNNFKQSTNNVPFTTPYENKAKGTGASVSAFYGNNSRYYNGNKFKLLNYNADVSLESINNKVNRKTYNITTLDEVTQYKDNRAYANLQIGFGTGRLEYVTDPIMAAFLLRDLQAKAGIGTLTNEQIENIGKGITTIRNTRFIDFRFRLIDQIEMLDSVLKANGVKSNKTSRYFTTINDNWLYATQFGRYTGKRWTYYLDNKSNISNNSTETNLKTINARHTKNTFQYAYLYNGIGINFDNSTQKGITRQNAWGANLNIGLQHNTNTYRYEDSISLSSYTEREDKFKPDAIISNIGIYYEYLWQPNTRTYFTARINPYLNTTISQNGLRVSNVDNSKTKSNQYGVNTNFKYFKFFTARLSTFIDVNFNLYNNNTVNSSEQTTSPNPIITSKNTRNDINLNHTIAAGITYVLF